jgi:DNA-binding beta-propeller fold protein YncE
MLPANSTTTVLDSRTFTGNPGQVSIALSLVLIASITGCAAKSAIPEVAWPDPPDKPRIKYVRSLKSADDVSGVAWREMLVGRDKTRALFQPMGLALSADGQRLYAVDKGWNCVFVFDFKAGAVRTIGEEERFPLGWPIGVALDAEENVYVSDTTTRSVRVYDKSGKFLRGIGKDLFVRPTGVALDAARQRLYVVDTGQNDTPEAHRVRVFDLGGRLLQDIGRRGSGDGEFNFPTNASLDAQGRLYVVDSANNRIEIFDPEGKFLWKFGRPGDKIGDFARAKGVAVDHFGNIYVVDSRWSNVQIFNQDGQLLMIFAGVGTYPGLLTSPTAIAIDGAGMIYVSDSFGRRVNVYELVNTTAEDSIGRPVDAPSPPTTTAGARREAEPLPGEHREADE